MRQFLLLLLFACEGTDTETTTETVTVAESVEHHEVIVTSAAPGELCPGASPYQFLICDIDFDGLGTEACYDMAGSAGTLLDGCFCWQPDGATWDCTATAPEGYEYRLSWWQASEPATE